MQLHGHANTVWECAGVVPQAGDRAGWLPAHSCLTNASSVDASTIMSRVCLVRLLLLAMMRSGTQPSEHSCWAILAASLLPCMLMGRS